jgi:hypothetical protein
MPAASRAGSVVSTTGKDVMPPLVKDEYSNAHDIELVFPKPGSQARFSLLEQTPLVREVAQNAMSKIRALILCSNPFPTSVVAELWVKDCLIAGATSGGRMMLPILQRMHSDPKYNLYLSPVVRITSLILAHHTDFFFHKVATQISGYRLVFRNVADKTVASAYKLPNEDENSNFSLNARLNDLRQDYKYIFESSGLVCLFIIKLCAYSMLTIIIQIGWSSQA